MTLGLATFASAVTAQDTDVDEATAAAAIVDDIDRSPERCISTSRLRDTHIIDDRTMLFYIRGGDVYVNQFRHECRGLKREGRFSYRSSVNRLCGTDSIRVLHYFGGNLEPGIACGLGQFFPVSEEEAEFLRYGDRSDIPQEPEAVDLPDDDDQEDSATDDGA